MTWSSDFLTPQPSDPTVRPWALDEFGQSEETIRRPLDLSDILDDPFALAAVPCPEELARLEEESVADIERERMVSEAYTRGYEDGRAEGETGEQARLRNAVKAAEQALDDVRVGEARWSGQIEENIIALSVAIARQIVDAELSVQPNIVRELVRKALSEFPIDQAVRVRVNPLDLAALTGRGVDLDGQRGTVAGRDARWLADSSVAPGGCLVEGRDRIIDGRVDTALERLYRRLSHTSA